MDDESPQADLVVAALYQFVSLENYQDLREPLLSVCHDARIKGTLLLAREGINGTIAGHREGIDLVLLWLRSDPRLEGLQWKESLPCERTVSSDEGQAEKRNRDYGGR